MGDYEYKRDPMVEDMHRQVQETLSIVYRVLTGKEPDGVVRREEIVTLAQKLHAEVTAMHRRAQALEGAEARMRRLRLTHAEQMAARMVEAEEIKKMWHARYRDGVRQIVDAGVDDRIQGDDFRRTGYLSEMIRRLVAQRDEARAHLAAELPAAWREDLEALNADVERLCKERDEARTKNHEAANILAAVRMLLDMGTDLCMRKEWDTVYEKIEAWK